MTRRAAPHSSAPKLLAALAGLSGIAPLATDMYVPGLPSVAADLNTGTAGVQVSMTCFLVGMICGQLILGPLSDQVGRRPVLLWGTAGFVVASILCAVTASILAFDFFRLVQGAAGAAGVVVARAVAADVYEGQGLASFYAKLGAITAAAPVLAPLLGGLLLAVLPWQAIFFTLAAIGAFLVAGVWFWVPESLSEGSRTRQGFCSAVRSMGSIGRRFAVMSPVLVVGFGGATIFAYIAGNTFVFHDLYGLSALGVSLVYGVNAVGNMVGSLGYGRLVTRWPPETLTTYGCLAALLAALALLATGLTGTDSFGSTCALLFVIVASFGVTFPGALTTAQERGRDAPGATSALLGGTQFMFGAASSPVVGAIGTNSVVPLSALMVTTLAAASGFAQASRRHTP